MKQLRKRLTYANVMSSIAVFLVLGGATAIAANQLGKNSVGSKQLKKNAVTTAKIKNNAVTTSKIKDGAISGAKVNLASLGTVPKAAHADNAANAANAAKATSAETANNANTVGGRTVKRVSYIASSPSGPQAVLTLGGLTISASCLGGTLEAFATTSVSNSLIHSSGVELSEAKTFYEEADDLDPGETFDIFPATGGDSIQGSVTYATPGGSEVVTLDFTSEEEDLATADCALVGNAIG